MTRLGVAAQRRILDRIRLLCLRFPETSERASHGESAFFYRAKRSFANTDTYHHGSVHYSLWVAAPLGAQDVLVPSDPAHFFIPPYAGHRGWVGVTLDDDPDWDAVAALVADAYARVGNAVASQALGARSRSIPRRNGCEPSAKQSVQRATGESRGRYRGQ